MYVHSVEVSKARCTLARRALIVGISHYDNFDPEAQLPGSIPDAQLITDLLQRNDNGDPNYDCVTLMSTEDGEKVTRPVLRDYLGELFRDTNDDVLFYFSGHGTVTPAGGVIVTQDGTHNDLGISMDELLTMANAAKEREVVLILDCCMSGSIGNPSILQSGDYQKSLLDQNVTILAASRHNEVSIEVDGQGIFTSLLAEALRGGAADILGNVTLPAIYAYVESALGPWEQRPIYKTYTTSVGILRVAEPQIEKVALRRLTELFDTPDGLYYLDPEYEYDEVPKTEKQHIAFLFKRYRDAGLLRATTRGKDFYWAAMHSQSMELTASGQHIWRLVNANRL